MWTKKLYATQKRKYKRLRLTCVCNFFFAPGITAWILCLLLLQLAQHDHRLLQVQKCYKIHGKCASQRYPHQELSWLKAPSQKAAKCQAPWNSGTHIYFYSLSCFMIIWWYLLFMCTVCVYIFLYKLICFQFTLQESSLVTSDFQYLIRASLPEDCVSRSSAANQGLAALLISLACEVETEDAGHASSKPWQTKKACTEAREGTTGCRSFEFCATFRKWWGPERRPAVSTLSPATDGVKHGKKADCFTLLKQITDSKM